MAHWLYLGLAIVFEVFGTTMLKVAAGAPSWASASGVAVGYGASFGQRLTLAGGAGIALIIAGVVVVQFNSTAH